MKPPTKFIIEGLDRLGKDTLIRGIQERLGYHQILHFGKPLRLGCYQENSALSGERRYQEASFLAMFQILSSLPDTKIICNRAHLGECVYAPIYRGYPGEYVFDIERVFHADTIPGIRMILLVEDLEVSKHFVDDGLSLGGTESRSEEQGLFRQAFEKSLIKDKRIICVTDTATGAFRAEQAILDDALA